MMCRACKRGDHANCSLAIWCDCESGLDGDPDAIPEEELEVKTSEAKGDYVRRRASRL